MSACKKGKDILFVSGLPRGGSFAMAKLLQQHKTGNVVLWSGLCDVAAGMRNVFSASPWHAGRRLEEQKLSALGNIFSAYHGLDNPDRSFSVDHGRDWPAMAEMIKTHYDERFKLIFCVRDLREILASFELYYRNTKASDQHPAEVKDFFAMLSAESRMLTLLNNDQALGFAVTAIRDMFTRGLGKHVLFVDMDKLLKSQKDCQKVMDQVTAFLEIPKQAFILSENPKHVRNPYAHPLLNLKDENASNLDRLFARNIQNRNVPMSLEWLVDPEEEQLSSSSKVSGSNLYDSVFDESVKRSPIWTRLSEAQPNGTCTAKFWESLVL